MAILLIQWTFRLKDPNRRLAAIVLMISCGVAMASHGELHFNLLGFLTQAAAVAVCCHYSSHFDMTSTNVPPIHLSSKRPASS